MKTYLWGLHLCGLAFSTVVVMIGAKWDGVLLFGGLSALALWGLISLHIKETYQR
jgi:hypothetical protein